MGFNANLTPRSLMVSTLFSEVKNNELDRSWKDQQTQETVRPGSYPEYQGKKPGDREQSQEQVSGQYHPLPRLDNIT